MRLSSLPRIAFIIAFCFFAQTSPLPAQQSEQPVFKCRLRTLGWQGAPNQLYLQQGRNYDLMTLRVGKLGEPFIYRGSPNLGIYLRKPVLVEGQLPPPPDYTVRLPQNNQDYILLVLPSPNKSAKGLHILPIQDSATRPPEGSLALVNTTPATLGLVVGTEKRELPPLKLEIVPLPTTDSPKAKEGRKVRQEVPLQIFWKGANGWENLRSTSIFMVSGSNEFMFLHEPVWAGADGLNGFAHDPIQWTMISR